MTTMEEVVEQTRSLHQELTEFVRHQLATNDEISVEALVRSAHKRFGQDPWMREVIFREGLKAIIPDIAGDVRHSLRTDARRGPSGEKGRREKIASVFEHVGDGITRSILTMRRPDHQFALEERESAVAGHMRWVGFHRAVVKLHTDDVTVTGDLPADKLSRIWRQHIENED